MTKLEREIKKLLQSIQTLAEDNETKISIVVFGDGNGWANGDKFREINIGYREPKNRALLR